MPVTRTVGTLCALTLLAGLAQAQETGTEDDFRSLRALEQQWQRGQAQTPGAAAPEPHPCPLSDNAQVDRAAHELGADQLHAQGLNGQGETIVVVDNRAFGERSLLAPLGDHYRLQVEVTQQVWAPEAQVQGLAAVNEGQFLLSLAEGVVADVLNRPWDQRRDREATVNVATRAVAQAPDDATISWVATLHHLPDAEVARVIATLGQHTADGGSVVIGSGAFSAEQLQDPAIAAAIQRSDLILVDAPRYDEQNRIVPSGQSLPSGAGDLATISVPTTLGHGSVAVPEVAGALALVRQARPDLTNAQILALMNDPRNFSQTTVTQDGQRVSVFDAAELLEAARRQTTRQQNQQRWERHERLEEARTPRPATDDRADEGRRFLRQQPQPRPQDDRADEGRRYSSSRPRPTASVRAPEAPGVPRSGLPLASPPAAAPRSGTSVRPTPSPRPAPRRGGGPRAQAR